MIIGRTLTKQITITCYQLHRPTEFDDPKDDFDLIPVFIPVFGAEFENDIGFRPSRQVFFLWHVDIFPKN